MSLHTWSRYAFCFAILSALLGITPLTAAEELQVERNEFTVGESVRLKIPGGINLLKPKWSANPKGIVSFQSKDRSEAVVEGIAPGRVTISARVKNLLGGDTSHEANLTVRPASLGSRSISSQTAKPQSASSSQSRSMPDAARMQQINDLMQRYDAELGSIRSLFDKQANPNRTPGMGELTERRLNQITEKFFHELGDMGLGMRDLQQFKDQYKTVAAEGHPLFPGQGTWDDHFLGTERALMMGRAQLVQRLWMETLQDTFRANPDAAVFGEIDIGSWVKMRLGDLGFQADIDFSSVAIDPDLNRSIVERFEGKLRRHTSLDMVRADALLTPHGQATADVFIGDWGKTFAELDMLKRSKWKVIKVEKNPDGSLVLDENGLPKIRMVEKPGTQLFWEVAFRKLEAGQFAEVDFPKMDLAKEPMLSLEMLRHGIHDIEHGPYSRGQKLIKMLKYAERSYFMSKKAVAEFGFNPYAANDPLLAQAAEKIIANKNDPEKVADLLRALSGEEITADNVDAVTDKLVARAKTAMHDNAARALAFRLNAIARIDADATRQKAAEKLWSDLGSELGTFRNTAGDPPRIMVEAQDMAKAVMEGKLPPAELEAKANDLHRLLNEAYKLPDSVIDRLLMSDSVLKLKTYLRKLGWIEKAIDDFTSKAKQKFPNMANFHAKVMELNQQLEKTTAGSGLLKAADWADNAFNVYEAYLNSDASDALLNASIAMGRIGAQSYIPSLQIPFALYDSLKSGSPKPLGMAVAFMYFPFAGQTYMVSGLMQRADVGMRDAEFYDALNKVLDITEFDTQGKITGFRLRNIIGKEIDSASISPPGNRQAIVDLFTKPDSTFYTSPNFRYWSSLVPRQDDRFGRYENKLQNLRRFFGLSEDVRYMTVMLENFKAKSDAMPLDRYTAQRQAALEKMEAQLTEAIWIAMADMLESSVRSVNVAELEARVKKFEDELNLSDIDLGKNKGLTARIKQEIRQNSSLLSGENPYAVALIYDRYIKAYEQVDALRKQIVLEIWNSGFGIDYVAAQGKPMKVLLMGGKIGAPALSGDPAKDVELAESTLAAHRGRAESIRADLGVALDRAVEAEKDKGHLKALGQIGLEWEHLLDDCANRAAPNCEASVRSALQQRVKLYKDYLAKLAAGNQALALEITGPAEMKLGESADFTAKFATPEDKSHPGLTLNWSVNGKAAGTGEKAKVKAEQAGAMNLLLSATSKASGSEKKLGEAVRTVTVKDPTDGKPPVASANLAAEIDTALKTRDWKRLADRLDMEKKSNLKMQDVVTWQANIDVLGAALKTLRDERMDWALAWREYIDALDHIDSITWDKLTHQVETKRTEVENRCWHDSAASEPNDKRVARCQAEGRTFEESCLGTWPAQHWEEMQRIRLAKQELPEAVHRLHSAGYGSYRNWFEAVEKLADKYKLPFPYPKPVTPRLKYTLSCANVELTAGKKPQDTLSNIQVRVEVPSAIVPYGKPVTLNASASGGKGPYRFAWSSGASGQRASVTPAWAGEWSVTVTATDADGKTGEGSATLQVSPMKVTLAGAKDQVYYGSSAMLSMAGMGLEMPAPDPCAGKPRSNNPYDECNTIQVTAPPVNLCDPPGSPFCVDTHHGGNVYVRKVDPAQSRYIPDPDREEDSRPPMASEHQDSRLPKASDHQDSQPPKASDYQIIWQSEPGLSFEPGKSSDGKTRVIYDRMGQVKLWCELLQFKEGDFHTVGECEQVTVTVVAPKFSVSFTPPEGQGRIGQDIRLRIASEPSVPDKLIDFRWLDPSTSNRLELTRNAREIGFKAKDAKPVVFKALARVPHYGDHIADIAATYTGLVFEVKAWVVEPGTRPMEWDPVKGGLKPVPKGRYATHERIPLRAELQGAGSAIPSDLRWSWSVNDGTTISSTISQTPTVSRSSPGVIQAHVQVRDTEGSVLGSTDVSVSVIEVRDSTPTPVNPTVDLSADRTSVERGETVSFSANVTGGKPPYRYTWQGASGQGASATLAATRTGNQAVSVKVTDSKGKSATARLDIRVTASAGDIAKDKAGKLAAQANQLAKTGNFEDAANLLQEASQQDADSVRPVAMQIRDQAKQAAAVAEKKRDFKAAGRLFEAARRIDQNDQAAQIGANNAVAYQQRQDAMLALQQQLAGHIARGDWHLAETAQSELKRIDEGLPGGITPETRDLIKRCQAGQATYTRQVEATRKDITTDLQGKRYDSARAKLAALRQTRLVPADEDWARGMAQSIDQAEQESRSRSGTGIQPGPGNIAGKWRSSEGELFLTQSGTSVTGSYSSDGGEIVGEMNGNVLEGYWIENSSNERCASAKNGRHHWGRIRWAFDGNKFSGTWSYCDKPVAGGGRWTGERIGDLPSGYTPPARTTAGSASVAMPDSAAVARPSQVGDSVGTWTLVANGHPGKLEISVQSGHLSARLRFDGNSRWEDLQDVRLDGNTLLFTRPIQGATQRYTGTLNGNELRGTFKQENTSRQYNWSASKSSVADARGLTPAPADTGSPAGSALAGTWAIDANGFKGKLEVTETGGRLFGRVWFDAHKVWEDLRDFSFDGHTLRFLRPGPGQRYTGTLAGDAVRGTFDQGGTGSWNWSLVRTAAATPSPTPMTTPRMLAFTWLGMEEDRVGEWGNGKPNGTLDGHFRLTLEAPDRFSLTSLSLWSANEKGEKTGGQIWHTRNGGNWMLGVFRDGRQLNTSHVTSLGEFSGRVVLDLYANSSGWFKPGQWFLLEVEDAGGKVTRQTLRLDASPVPAGGRDYTGHDSPMATADGRPGSGYLRIEACVDGSDWIGIESGQLVHRHRAFDQIGTHGGCPATHRVAGGGFLVDGLPVALTRLPMPVGMAGIGRFEVERGRGQVRLDGANRILIDDDGPGGADVYIIRLYPSATTAGTPPDTIVPAGRDYTAAPAQGQLIFEVGNIGGVGNGPSKAIQFTLATPHVITLIRNYHWNSARGAAPGSIALKSKDGANYGPWQATGSPGQGGVPNANWTVYPNITLPAGTYTVIDSDPASWSHNSQSGNRGFVRVEGYAATDRQAATLPEADVPQAGDLMKEIDGLIDAIKSLKGLFGK